VYQSGLRAKTMNSKDKIKLDPDEEKAVEEGWG
jgi:hypothetical protein